MALKENLYRFRTAANLTQQELADKCGVARPMITGIETGVKNPSASLLAVLATVLGCSIDDLVFGPDEHPH